MDGHTCPLLCCHRMPAWTATCAPCHAVSQMDRHVCRHNLCHVTRCWRGWDPTQEHTLPVCSHVGQCCGSSDRWLRPRPGIPGGGRMTPGRGRAQPGLAPGPRTLLWVWAVSQVVRPRAGGVHTSRGESTGTAARALYKPECPCPRGVPTELSYAGGNTRPTQVCQHTQHASQTHIHTSPLQTHTDPNTHRPSHTHRVWPGSRAFPLASRAPR